MLSPPRRRTTLWRQLWKQPWREPRKHLRSRRCIWAGVWKHPCVWITGYRKPIRKTRIKSQEQDLKAKFKAEALSSSVLVVFLVVFCRFCFFPPCDGCIAPVFSRALMNRRTPDQLTGVFSVWSCRCRRDNTWQLGVYEFSAQDVPEKQAGDQILERNGAPSFLNAAQDHPWTCRYKWYG